MPKPYDSIRVRAARRSPSSSAAGAAAGSSHRRKRAFEIDNRTIFNVCGNNLEIKKK